MGVQAKGLKINLGPLPYMYVCMVHFGRTHFSGDEMAVTYKLQGSWTPARRAMLGTCNRPLMMKAHYIVN